MPIHCSKWLFCLMKFSNVPYMQNSIFFALNDHPRICAFSTSQSRRRHTNRKDLCSFSFSFRFYSPGSLRWWLTQQCSTYIGRTWLILLGTSKTAERKEANTKWLEKKRGFNKRASTGMLNHINKTKMINLCQSTFFLNVKIIVLL